MKACLVRNFIKGNGVKTMMQFIIILFLAVLAAGCTTQSKARAEAQKAYLAGQNAALQRAQAAQSPGITVMGPVQNSYVPWVAGITIAQAIATANYTSPTPPSKIVLSRQGEDAAIDANDLDRATQITLQAGDIITLVP